MYQTGFIHKCAGVVKSCWHTFKTEPIASLINAVLLSIVAIGVNNLLPIVAVAFAVFVDIVTGVVKARRRDDLEYNSDNLKQKLIDIAVYALVIILSLTLTFWASWLIVFSWLVSGFIMWIELESIKENMMAAGYNVGWLDNLLEAFKRILDNVVKNIGKQ